jgi:hypothetical protein
MTDHDEVADLADRMRAKMRRGEEPGIELAIEFGALTEEERDAFMALVEQRRAQGEERHEALVENVRILRLLFAYQEGAITALEFVERVRGAVPDPLAQQKPD